jgi:hypothetical protein
MRALHNSHSPARSVAAIIAKVAASVVLAAAGVTVLLSGTVSSFNQVSSNASNALSAGTISITDNDAGTALLSLTNAKPGDTATGCVVVSYSGVAPSSVVMYGTPGGTLGDFLDLKVTRGTISGTPVANSCTNFTADAVNYIGQGNGVVFSGVLSTWPATSAAGVVDPVAGTPRIWATGESHAYRVQVTLQSALAAQGRTATQTFTWQAANN